MWSNVFGRGGAALNGKSKQLPWIYKRPKPKLTAHFLQTSFVDGHGKPTNIQSIEPMANRSGYLVRNVACQRAILGPQVGYRAEKPSRCGLAHQHAEGSRPTFPILQPTRA
jgi:hypothetical protein